MEYYRIVLYRMKLPNEIINRIFLYNSHPVADLMRIKIDECKDHYEHYKVVLVYQMNECLDDSDVCLTFDEYWIYFTGFSNSIKKLNLDF